MRGTVPFGPAPTGIDGPGCCTAGKGIVGMLEGEDVPVLLAWGMSLRRAPGAGGDNA